MKLLRIISLALVCALPVAASAQWIWLDKGGRKVFSDQAPPADVPAKDIVKQPGVRMKSAQGPAEAASAPASAAKAAKAAASAPKLSGKEKELEEKKKLAEAAEAEKKKAEEERVAKAKAESCNRAKQAKKVMDSGVRVVQANAKGEPEILDDAGRAAENKRLQGIVEADCK